MLASEIRRSGHIDRSEVHLGTGKRRAPCGGTEFTRGCSRMAVNRKLEFSMPLDTTMLCPCCCNNAVSPLLSRCSVVVLSVSCFGETSPPPKKQRVDFLACIEQYHRSRCEHWCLHELTACFTEGSPMRSLERITFLVAVACAFLSCGEVLAGSTAPPIFIACAPVSPTDPNCSTACSGQACALNMTCGSTVSASCTCR